MRVLILGAGATGGYFGGRMLEKGCDATFLARPRRRAQLEANGLVIKSPAGDIALPCPPTTLAGEIAAPWDLILLACKAYDLPAAMDAIAPAVGPDTMILPLLNGMRHLDALDSRFGRERVLGGTCSIVVTVEPDGVIRHFSDLHSLTFGERDGADSPRVQAIAEMLAPVNIQWRLSSNIIQEMWEKWVFLSTLAAATCVSRASIGDIVAAGGAEAITMLLDEARSVAKAAGCDPRPQAFSDARRLLTAADSPLTASMLRDIRKGGAVEADHVIGDLAARGRAAGVHTPLLKIAHLHLKAYEARRQASQMH